jgi:RNA polymerase sigma factor (sigma-70 family)
MASGRLGQAVRQLCGLIQSGAAADHADGLLLERFAHQADQDAFTALVQRHSRLVYGVCRRILGDVHEAEDAFQATFLILARKAATLDRSRPLSGWLYTVASNTALRARAEQARRPRQQPQDLDMPEPIRDKSGPELNPTLDAELNRLPDKYRLPLVLCYLEGKTNDEAAHELRWPSGTVKGRLARARDLLRQRLARRGLVLSAVGLTAALADASAAVAAPPSLIQSTTQAAAAFAAGHVATLTGSAKAVALATEGLRAMTWMKLKLIGTAAVVATIVAGGAGFFTHQMLAAQRQDNGNLRATVAADDKDAKPDERLLAALKDVELVFTAKIAKSQQAAANAPARVTFEDAKALRGNLPQNLDFLIMPQNGKDARMHLTKGDTVLVLAKARPPQPGSAVGAVVYVVQMSVPATESTVEAVKKALANQK